MFNTLNLTNKSFIALRLLLSTEKSLIVKSGLDSIGNDHWSAFSKNISDHDSSSKMIYE